MEAETTTATTMTTATVTTAMTAMRMSSLPVRMSSLPMSTTMSEPTTEVRYAIYATTYYLG
jgi:hypothetical protein